MAARPRVALSPTYLSIDQPRQWLHLITSALLAQAEQIKQSADFATPLQENFGLTFDMVDAQAALAIQESEQLATMALFAAVEAGLQIDYQNRIRRRVKKGKALRQLYKKINEATTRKKLQAPPVELLLDSWKQVHPQIAQLAHGRYWVFRGNEISHDLLFHLASRLFDTLEASEAGFHPDPLHKS